MENLPSIPSNSFHLKRSAGRCFLQLGTLLSAGLVSLGCLTGAESSVARKDSDTRATPAPDGALWKRHAVDDTGKGADGVKLGDINGDGRPDLVTGWEEGGEVRVYINPGPDRIHALWPRVTVGKAPDAEDALFVDLDGDGTLDVVTCAEGRTKTLFWHRFEGKGDDLLDPGKWTTVALPTSGAPQLWMQAAAMDVDGRNGPDLIVGSKLKGGALGWLEAPAGPKDREVWTFRPLREAGWIMSIELHDMDRDGDRDVVFSDRRGPRSGVFWMENPGSEQKGALWKEHAIGAVGRSAMFLDVADLNRDCRIDVIAAVKAPDEKRNKKEPLPREGREVVVCYGMEDGSWKESSITLAAENLGEPKAVKAADVNGDGLEDILFTAAHADGKIEGIVWLEQTKEGSWIQHRVDGPEGVKYDLMQTIDLDGDGDLDFVTTEERDQLGVIWFENPSRGKSDSP